MAFSVVFSGNSYNENGTSCYVELQCNTRSDVSSLPTTGYLAGSECFCLEDASVWVLKDNGSSLVWAEVVV